MKCIHKFIYLVCFSPLGAILWTTAFEIWNRDLFPTSVYLFLVKWTSFKQHVILCNALASQSFHFTKYTFFMAPNAFLPPFILKNLVITVKYELLITKEMFWLSK